MTKLFNFTMAVGLEQLQLVMERGVNKECLILKKNKRWQTYEDEVLKKYYKKKTLEEIGNTIGRTAISVENRARRLGISRRSKYNLNKSYFKEIITLEQAYWLGFIYADGAVIYNKDNRNYELSIELQQQDKNHLVKFNKTINGNYQVKERVRSMKLKKQKEKKTYYSAFLRIYSKEFVENLIKQNVVPQKSIKDSLFPQFENEELFTAFIIGVFDGDGSIFFDKKTRSRSKINIVSVNVPFLEKISEVLNKKDIKTSINISHNNQEQTLYRLNIKGICSYKLFCQLYLQLKNTTLERKRKEIELLYNAL